MDPSPQPQVTLPHDNEVTESRGVVIELESESGSCIVDNIGHDSDTDVNNLCDFDEYDDEDDSEIQFRDISEIRLISVESGSDDDPEDEREIWGIDLNEEDVYDDDDDDDDDDEDDVSVTIHSLQVEDRADEFDWEEVDNGGGEGEIVSGFAEANISLEDLARSDDSGNNLEWQVLMNSHTLEINFDVESRELHIVGDHDDYIHTAEYDLLFEQFAQAGITNLRFPPTSESFIKNLPVVVQLDVENGDCAVCKDEMSIGSEAVLLLPCNHKYHGGCIVPWLETRNTCPVCRYELPTDDVDYERRKSHIRR